MKLGPTTCRIVVQIDRRTFDYSPPFWPGMDYHWLRLLHGENVPPNALAFYGITVREIDPHAELIVVPPEAG